MAAITIDEETKERLRNFVAEEEDYNKILNRLMDSIEQIDEVYVELQREKLERNKEKFISLEDYVSIKNSRAQV
ncbi:hypothetical protein C5S35_14110 [Candidatus Methanophagaceae archaeon]|nr:MAG: hypothetical protein C5S38_04310 [Methanophagales archaeon]KAF5434472.1 hypothetical protein C5S35_14110 [Methanophagales archaeon]